MTDAFDHATRFLIEDLGRNAGLLGTDAVLATLGCRLALPLDPGPLADHLEQALENGTTADLLDAAFLHAIGYLGVVRIAPAHRVLMDVTRSARRLEAPDTSVIPLDHDDRVAKGTALYDRFDPGRAASQGELYETISETYYPMAMELAGITLAHPALDARQRQIMTIAMLACLGGQPAQLSFHAKVALERGVSRDEMGAILILVQSNAGLPRANAAALLIRDVLKGADSSK